MRLFSLCMVSLPPMFIFVSRLVFIQFPLVFFGLFSSSNLLCSNPILSTYLPSRSAAGTLFPIRSVLSCLLDFCYVAQQPPLFLCPHLPTLLIRSQEATSSLLLVLFIYVFFFPQEIE